LSGLTRQPYLRQDGSLMTAAGFDPATGMFGVFDAREFSVPQNPTRADAEAALAVLKDVLTEFSFATRQRPGCGTGCDPDGSCAAQPGPRTDVPCHGRTWWVPASRTSAS
jgi:hypothetical protein